VQADGHNINHKARLYWYAKIDHREKEIRELIGEFLVPTFGLEALKLGAGSVIDGENVIVGGHSTGGATAMKVGESDNRVKAIVTHDPWSTVIDPLIDNFKMLVEKPV